MNLPLLFLEVAFAPGAKSDLTSSALAAGLLRCLGRFFYFLLRFESKFLHFWFSRDSPHRTVTQPPAEKWIISAVPLLCKNNGPVKLPCVRIPLLSWVCFPNYGMLIGEGCLRSCHQWSHIPEYGPEGSGLGRVEHLSPSPTRRLWLGREKHLPEVSSLIKACLKPHT